MNYALMNASEGLFLFGYDVTWYVGVGGFVLGVIGFLVAIYAFGTDESAKETQRRQRRTRLLRHLRATGLTVLLGAGYVYAAEYVPDNSHCSQSAWNGAVDAYGYWSALVLWYATGC